MFIPANPTPKQFAMLQDACFIAGHVVSDLGPAFSKPGDFWTQYLADRFAPFTYADLTSRHAWGAYYHKTDAIEIEKAIPKKLLGQVVRHEICHALCIGTERYADLNQPRFAEYDFRTFHEMIAELVHMAYSYQPLLDNLLILAG